MLDEPGLDGLLPRGSDGFARLLVTDDRACDRVAALLPNTRAGLIIVCAAAVRSAGLLDADPAWRAGNATAMTCHDLRTVCGPELPAELTLRPVQRLDGDDAAGVPLGEAVGAACRADPGLIDPRTLVDHLRSLPHQFALWAAVDPEGVVRGTSGSAAFGTTASVIFVNTDPGWRRRGIAQAMTVTALRAAEQAGARQASLDASGAGRELYLSLGFQTATSIRRFRAEPQ
ncbi:MAG TPA: GNAT family N-acetyltransferase [Solirubrobacteraceae bacterium]|nr:GNAT family N-acetyltransferase [Solirubrobacteraceae bacterium]